MAVINASKVGRVHRYQDRQLGLSAPLRRLTAWLVLASYLTYPGALWAQGIAGAPGSAHAPGVEQSRNGVPVVNINRPSAGGVSRNEYDRFNVGREGAILNNSPDIVRTQLGGYIDGNAALKGQSARIILNEVTSANPSRLGGYTEVAGRAAEVVIANPNGISCDGCGFINTTRGVLTTGKALFDKKGGLQGYRVEGGEIAIEGAGLNAGGLDQLDILSRAVRVNSELWADQLNLVTGRNQIDHQTLAATPLAPAGEQGVALDVAAIGGMYANRIHIVGTEKGFGVNQAGQLVAHDEFSLSADGRITLAGVTRAVSGTLDIAAMDTIDNRGQTTGGAVRLQADAELLNTGLVQADREADILAGEAIKNTGTLIAADTNLVTHELHNAGGHALIAGLDTLTAHADGRLENRSGGQIFSLGDMRLTSDGTIVNESSLIEAGGTLALKAEQLINRKEAFETEDVVTRNVYSNIPIPVPSGYKSARRSYTETIVETVVTRDSAEGQILAGGDMLLEGAIDNIYSTISAGGDLSFQGAYLNNQSYAGRYEVTHQGTDSLVYSERYCKRRVAGVCVSRGRRDRTETRGYNSTRKESLPLARAVFTASQDLTGQAGSVRNGDAFFFKPYDGQGDNGSVPGWMPSSWQRGSDGIILSDTGLFSPATDPGHPYLLETDPRLTSYKEFISSDYMLERLDHDPSKTVKRLGDGFVEQRLVRDQILGLTGLQYLGDYAGIEEQYLRLMENALAVAESLQLRPGVELTAEQIEQLREPIVWMVEETFQTANGIETAWVPKVYLPSAWDGELRPDGALIAARNVSLDVEGALESSGSVLAAENLDARANTIVNRGDLGATDTLTLKAEQTLHNIGGRIKADEIDIAAGGDIFHQTEAERIDYYDAAAGTELSGTQTLVGRQAVIEGGQVRLRSGGRIEMTGAQVNSTGALTVKAAGDIALNSLETLDGVVNGDYHREVRVGQLTSELQAGGPLQIATTDGALVSQGALLRTGENLILSAAEIRLNAAKLREESFSRLDRGLDGAKMQDVLNEIILGSQLDAYGAVLLASEGDIHSAGSSLNSVDGAIALLAGGNINLAAEQQRSRQTVETRKHSSGFLSSSTKTTRTSTEVLDAIGTTLDGKEIRLEAGQNITITAGQLVASEDVALAAGKDITLQAGEHSLSQTSATTKKKSGLMSGGGLSVSIGKQRLSTREQLAETTAAATTLGSLEGNVTVQAGGRYRQTGSDLIALAGDIDVQAQDIAITEARESSRYEEEYKFRQSGVTIGLTGAAISAVEATGTLVSATRKVESRRMQALGAGMAALNAKDAYDSGQAIVNAVQNEDGVHKGSGIGINISLGSAKSERRSLQTSDTARGSAVQASGNVSLIATGAGQDSNILLRGSEIDAGANATLLADNRIDLVAAENRAEQQSADRNSSASVGIGINFGGEQNGLTITAAVAQGRGSADGTDVWHSNSRITAGDTTMLSSGGDTTIRGAHVAGHTVKADIGGDLNLESLQDTSTYSSKQKHAGGGVSVCIPPLCYGSTVTVNLSLNRAQASGHYASVTEQTGIQAGEGGFDLRVDGNTDLKGATITSSQAAIDAGRNSLVTGTLTVSDIENRAEARAKSRGISVSSDMFSQGKYGLAKAGLGTQANKGSAGDFASGSTKGAISQGAVIITDEAKQLERTGVGAEATVAALNRDTTGAHTAVKKLDVEKLEKQAEAEQVIRQEAYRQATLLTDAVYKADNGEKKIFLTKCSSSGGDCQSQEIDLSDHELVYGPDGKLYVFNHGILNDEVAALENAVKQHGDAAIEQGIYTIINPHTGNSVSEVIYAGLDKLREVTGLTSIFGISNASEANVDLRNAVAEHNQHAAGDAPARIVEVAHSRGSLTASNATHAQHTAGSTDVPLAHVQFHGAAANAQRMADRVAQATGGSGSVWQATHKDDFVSTLIGGNHATGGRNAGFLDAHTNYGPGVSGRYREKTWGTNDGSRVVEVRPKK